MMIWFDKPNNEMEWDRLFGSSSFSADGNQNITLVTSRWDILPAALCCKQVVRLEDMEDTEFLALFKYHAFSGAEVRSPHLREMLEGIAEKIAIMLWQSPLAARTVGPQLSRKKDITAWKDALTIKIDNLSEPIRALLWSYEKLDPRRQMCFLYCSLSVF